MMELKAKMVLMENLEKEELMGKTIQENYMISNMKALI